MRIPIYVIGSSNTDMVVKADKLPRPGETVMGGTFFMNPGGKGANQAVAASRLGGQVIFVAHVGNDVFGTQAVEHFNQEKIDTTFVTTDSVHPSGVALINIDSKGENSITVAPGSNSLLDRRKVENALKNASPPGIMLIQMEILMPTIEFAIDAGYAKGLKVILNPAPAQKINHALLNKLYLITPNESEAEVLTGIQVGDTDSAAQAARSLQQMGALNVVITLGAKGAYVLTDKIARLVPAPIVNSVIDTTAAGDCFNGALATALSEDQPIEEAVAFACSAASISVTRLGAQASLPYRDEVNKLASGTHSKSVLS